MELVYNIQEIDFIQMNSVPKLTTNGVLYLSLGFKQNYYLQVLTLRIGEQKDLQLVLYDGLAYIGAIYCPNSFSQSASNKTFLEIQNFASTLLHVPKQFDIIRIFPLNIMRNQPILVDQLEIIYSGLTSLLGKQVLSLQEFMHRRDFSRKYIQIDCEQQVIKNHSRKIIKLMDQESNHTSNNSFKGEKIDLNIDQVQYQSNTHKNTQCQLRLGAIEEKETQKLMIQTQPIMERQQIMQEHIKQGKNYQQIMENDHEQPQELATQKNQSHQSQKQSIILLISQEFTLNKNKVVQIDVDSDIPPSNPIGKSKIAPVSMHIHDLYERMHRFRILCRINYLSQFTSQKGTFCTKLILIDELGDQIICMIYEKMQQKQSSNHLKLAKGRSYIFQNGQVLKDQNGISITVPWTAITQQHKFIPSFVPSKMNRLSQLEKQATFFIEKAINLQKEKQTNKKPQQINVCGIFKGFKFEPRLIRNLFRVHGIICDPDQELSIHFFLLVDELASFPQPGAVVSLHNVLVTQDGERTLHIQNTKKSYILNEAGNTHQYFADLLKSSILKNWTFNQYRDLSQVTYVARTISELKVLLSRMLQNELAYSQIDCNITNVSEKKFYNSCVTCKRQTKPQSGLFTYCYNCRKLVKYNKRFLFDLEVSDPTGSIICSLSSDELLGFINISGEDYGKYQKEDRLCYLQLSAYQNIIMKIKSQRIIGGVNHRAVSATKANHQRGLSQIRSLVIDQKTKYNNSW